MAVLASLADKFHGFLARDFGYSIEAAGIRSLKPPHSWFSMPVLRVSTDPKGKPVTKNLATLEWADQRIISINVTPHVKRRSIIRRNWSTLLAPFLCVTISLNYGQNAGHDTNYQPEKL